MWVEFMTLDDNGDMLKAYSILSETLEQSLNFIQKWADAFDCIYHYAVMEASEWEALKGFAYCKENDRNSHLIIEHNTTVISRGIIYPNK